MENNNGISFDTKNQESKYTFSDYFDVAELQKIQDLFSEATGVASIITEPDGTPITEPSGFCGLCNEIRKTEKGFIHCKLSDSIIGKTNEVGPNIQRCYSGGLLDAGASIIVEGKHIGNWMIGQIIDEDQPEEALKNYAVAIGLHEAVFQKELLKVKRMPRSQFESISNFLFKNAQMISRYAKNIAELSYELEQKNRHEAEIKKLNEELEEKNKEIKKFFGVSSDLFSITDIRGNFYNYNKAWESILGYTEEDLKTMRYQDYLHPEDVYAYYQVMKQIEETGKNIGFTPRFRHKDGSYRYVEWSCIKEGRYYYSADRDVTERMETERALHETERSKATLISNLPGIVYRCKNDENWTMTFLSEGCYELTGYKPEELLENSKISYTEIIAPDFREALNKLWGEELAERKVSQVEYPIITASGKTKWVWEQSQGVCDSHGNLIASEGYITDITERRETEQALISSDSRLRRAQEIAHIGNWELDLKDYKIWASDEAFKIYGIEKRSDYLNLKEVQQIVAEEDRPRMDDALKSLINESADYNVDYQIIRPKDGSKRILNSQAIIEYDSNGNPSKVSGVIQDITKKKQSEQILKESEERFRTIFLQSPFGIALVDSVSHWIYQANNKYVEILGWSIEELNSMNWSNITDPEDLDSIGLWDTFQKGEIDTFCASKRFIRKDEAYVWTNLTISRVEVENYNNKMHIVMLEDITQNKKAEEEIQYYSMHDQLTDAYNRRYYEEEIKKLDQKENLPISIIVGDVNGFKLFNDAFGYSQGDKLLKRVAEIIRSVCRPDDIVLRWGGDEFVIILPKTGMKDTVALVDQIREKCAKEVINEINISISLGWDVKKEEEYDIRKTMKNAEDQMYKHKIVESEGLRGNVIKTVIHTLHEKSPREEMHSIRVSNISQSIGKALQLPELEVNKLKAVGLLHDIGKIGVEGSILDKVGALTQKEYEEVKRHPDIGYRILSASSDMKELAEITLSHHERWDGKGYPKGLKGEEIPILSRIVSLADSYDAMTSDRPYRKALTKEETIHQILENSGTQFDQQIANIFINTVMPDL